MSPPPMTTAMFPALITRERQNAARIRARGVELEAEARVGAALVLTGASAYTDSVFTAGPFIRETGSTDDSTFFRASLSYRF